MKTWQNVYWTQQSELLEFQGATVTHAQIDQVNYENDIYASGFGVVVWRSLVNFRREFRQETLMPLVPGHEYRFRLDAVDEGLNTYLLVTMYDQAGTIILSSGRGQKEVQLVAPANLDHYDVQIIAFGNGRFVFEKIFIQEVLLTGTYILNDYVSQDGRTLARYVNRDANRHLFVAFTEPLDKETQWPIASATAAQVPILLFANLGLAADYYQSSPEFVTTLIHNAQRDGRYDTISLVGTGLISQLAAAYYGELLQLPVTWLTPLPDYETARAHYARPNVLRAADAHGWQLPQANVAGVITSQQPTQAFEETALTGQTVSVDTNELLRFLKHENSGVS